MSAEVTLNDIEVARTVEQVGRPEHSERRRLHSTSKHIKRPQVRSVPVPRAAQRQKTVEWPRRQPFVACEGNKAVALHVRMGPGVRGATFGEDRNLVAPVDQTGYLAENECLR